MFTRPTLTRLFTELVRSMYSLSQISGSAIICLLTMCDFRNSTSVFYFIRIVVNIVVVIIIILLLSATKMFESGQEQTLYCSAFSSVPRPVFEITLVLGKKTKSPKIPTHHSNYYYYYSKPHSSNISAFSRRTARSDILKTLSLFLSQSMLFVS